MTPGVDLTLRERCDENTPMGRKSLMPDYTGPK